MFYKGEPESDLNKIAKAVARIDGVIAAILFGSRARGDYDEYSDRDVLVIPKILGFGELSPRS